ncbi:hypothetical protein GRF63_12680 [Erythrobacter sp. GH3-10]|uniref:Uncharacterized protein n=2 Tax=Aurantiacibacter rhizosphaerae TaxID=2691582 RepID=A0A844XGI2_9SPHN|nr:hypothetical protein [Aurantiacibacter rhizosphaerae]
MVIFNRSANRTARYNGGWIVPAAVNLPVAGATVDAEARAAIGEIVEALKAAGILATE